MSVLQNNFLCSVNETFGNVRDSCWFQPEVLTAFVIDRRQTLHLPLMDILFAL